MADENKKNPQNNQPENPQNRSEYNPLEKAQENIERMRKRLQNLPDTTKKKPEIRQKIQEFSQELSQTQEKLQEAVSQANIGRIKEINLQKMPLLEQEIGAIEFGIEVSPDQKFRQSQQVSAPPLIYRDPDKDPIIRETRKEILRKTNTDPEVIAAKKGTGNYQDAWKKAYARVNTQEWNGFVEKNPDKTRAYVHIYKPVEDAYARKLKSENEKSKDQKTEEKAQKLSFKDSPEFEKHFKSELHNRVWKEFPNSTAIYVSEYDKQTEIVREEIEKEFMEKNPDIVEKYNKGNFVYEKNYQSQPTEFVENTIPNADESGGEVIIETSEESPIQPDNDQSSADIPGEEERTQIRQNARERARGRGLIRNINNKAKSAKNAGRAIKALGRRAAGMVAKQGTRMVATTAAAATSEVWVPILIGIVAFFAVLLVILAIVMAISGQDRASGQPGQIIPTPSPQISTTPYPTPITPPGDLSGCSFYRGDLTPPEALFQSSVLLSYFKDAASLTGVAATILAGIARIETPSSVTYDNIHLNRLGILPEDGGNCPQSPTGALGIMQIQPAGTTGHCESCVRIGAEYAGLQYESLTRADYCNIRTSTIMGAGFIIGKMQALGYIGGTRGDSIWTTDRQYTDAIARSYYGCLLYPSCSAGPHSYGNDLWNSVSNCRPPESLTQILKWTNDISNVLELGSYVFRNNDGSTWRGYNRMMADITNNVYNATKRAGDAPNTATNGLYWCTNLVIDSYNLAGIPGLKLGTDEAVTSMVSTFRNTQGYSVIDYTGSDHQSALSSVLPGYAMFQESVKDTWNGSEHVAIVNEVTINSVGDGRIVTTDSNTPTKTRTYSVSSWNIINPMYSGWIGFGAIQ